MQFNCISAYKWDPLLHKSQITNLNGDLDS